MNCMYSGKSQMEGGGNSVVTFCRRDQLFIFCEREQILQMFRFLPHFQASLSHNEDGVCCTEKVKRQKMQSHVDSS